MTYPFIPAYHYSAGHNLPLSRIVIHGTVSATRPGGAREVATYFQSPNSGGSTQYIVDPGEIIQAAADDTICWHAPPNINSLGVEFCDWVNWAQGNGKTVADLDSFWTGKTQADFDARWSLPAWDQMLRLGAGLVHALAVEYSVPITRISVADLLAGRHGLCGHVDVSQAWHQTDHSDPGLSFPWATFIDYILAIGLPPVITHPPVVVAPTVGVLAVDGGLGPATISRWQRVMGTPVDGAISTPSQLVSAVQQRLNARISAGLTVDGLGIAQDGRVYKTVGALQRYLGTYSDGILSLPSSACVKALQVRLNQNRF